MTLTVCGALEELLPKFLGVGFPFLLAASAILASDRTVVSLVAFSIAAGAFEDSLSSLPLLTSPCFFVLVAVVARRIGLTLAVMAVAYPLYQVWICLVAPGTNGGFFGRFFLSLPLGVVAFALAELVLHGRKESIGEA